MVRLSQALLETRDRTEHKIARAQLTKHPIISPLAAVRPLDYYYHMVATNDLPSRGRYFSF